MIVPESILLEQVSLLTPLAIRFRDPATRSLVSEGLDVSVRTLAGGGRAVPAFPNRSGMFVARGLPGLRDLEAGAGDDAFWDDLSDTDRRTFAIEVNDRKGRYLPWRIEADLPNRGLVSPACLPSLPPMSGVPLYSSPARPPVPGMAVIRVEMDTVSTDGDSVPARWALVQVKVGPETALGLADERGVAMVLVPYPKPGNGSTVPLSDMEWPVELQVSWSPDPAAPKLPELCQTLGQQPASVFRDRAGTEAFAPLAGLRFGRELVLTGDPSGKVFVRPTA